MLGLADGCVWRRSVEEVDVAAFEQPALFAVAYRGVCDFEARNDSKPEKRLLRLTVAAVLM